LVDQECHATAESLWVRVGSEDACFVEEVDNVGRVAKELDGPETPAFAEPELPHSQLAEVALAVLARAHGAALSSTPEALPVLGSGELTLNPEGSWKGSFQLL
jgi:hypothetical protein